VPERAWRFESSLRHRGVLPRRALSRGEELGHQVHCTLVLTLAEGVVSTMLARRCRCARSAGCGSPTTPYILLIVWHSRGGSGPPTSAATAVTPPPSPPRSIPSGAKAGPGCQRADGQRTRPRATPIARVSGLGLAQVRMGEPRASRPKATRTSHRVADRHRVEGDTSRASRRLCHRVIGPFPDACRGAEACRLGDRPRSSSRDRVHSGVRGFRSRQALRPCAVPGGPIRAETGCRSRRTPDRRRRADLRGSAPAEPGRKCCGSIA
jgi:hypothetical protein